MKTMRLFLLLCVLFVACSDDTGSGPSSLTICTYNVEDFNLSNDSYNKVATFVAGNSVDLICLQEVQPGNHPNNSTAWNSPNNAGDESAFTTALENAGRAMDHNYFSTSGGIKPTYGDYLAYFSRFPLKKSDSILLGYYQDPVSGQSFSMSSLRPIVYTTTLIGNRTLHLYGLHLKAQKFYPEISADDIKKRRAQAHALENRILTRHDPLNDLIVILGDANTALTNFATQPGDDFADDSTLGILCLKSDSDSANDFTPMNVHYLAANAWTHSVYPSRLDHLILSPAALAAYVPGSVRIVTHPPNDPADHYPVLLRLEVME